MNETYNEKSDWKIKYEQLKEQQRLLVGHSKPKPQSLVDFKKLNHSNSIIDILQFNSSLFVSRFDLIQTKQTSNAFAFG